MNTVPGDWNIIRVWFLKPDYPTIFGHALHFWFLVHQTTTRIMFLIKECVH